ncbi:MAG: Unknown protein [uncultured Thiotrichaceae bacterium]|uniref:Inner membrane protein n=1 Tax=uncultured Thiotrichaceae bacterium TaxID=298394 RepID=A0A6S6UCN0_9GAMM|nr:MAG: Unknown protein [uncultured Thiotrichaceae bacterium]
MSALQASLVLAFLIIVAIVVFSWSGFRLKKALAKPFIAEWQLILRRNLPVYSRLPNELREQLERNIKQFLHQKQFSGSNGLVVTDEMRVTIAAYACLLLLNRETGVYPQLKYIIIYPDAFRVERQETDEAGLVSTQERGLSGESWSNGKVILSWANVVEGNRDLNDGNNVTLHEFAHQLDGENGAVNGAPILGSAGRYEQWSTILSKEFESLQEAAWSGDRALLNSYGATNPAEFFAVVTEHFFEQPEALAKQHPELFEVFRNYYQVDPAEWHD